MKKSLVTRIIGVCAAVVITLGSLVGCSGSTSDNASTSDSASTSTSDSADTTESKDESATKGGKILYLSNLTSGAFYDFYVAFYEKACEDLGYDFEIVYGDGYNDPDGNLSAIRNAYTSDVVGMIACQDGGIESIMEEYPDMYVATLNSDMDAIFNDDGTSHGALEKDHFLGSMGDNFLSGEDLGKAYAEEVIQKGYTKVSTCIFPVYAYPKHTAADAAFRAAIEEYNKTASTPVEIVGDATVLEFKPLDASYFLEEGYSDLDCIVGFCAGTQMIYPTLITAKGDGTCSADTKLITGGFESNSDILADSGDDKTVVSVTIAAPESAVFPLVMIDNAVQGKQFADFKGAERMSSGIVKLNSTEAFEAFQNNGPLMKADLSKMQMSWEDMKQLFTRYNDKATYADLVKTTTSFSIEGYMN